jgi:pilin isopeptide linkage protein
MPSGSVNGVKTVTVTGSGSAEFGTWQYTQAGIYRYTVYEADTGEQDYSYDAEVYTITDTVTAVGGQLAVSRVVTNGSHRQVASLGFINTYTGTGTNPTPSPGGQDGPLPSPGGSTPSPSPGGPTPRPGGPNDGGQAGPKTGDDAPYAAYTVLFWLAAATALGSIILLLLWRKRREPEA